MEVRCLVLLLTAATIYAQQFQRQESDISLRGSILRYFGMNQANPSACEAQCAADARCKAFTYVRPGGYRVGDAPMCYLFANATARDAHRCCISGLRTGFYIAANIGGRWYSHGGQWVYEIAQDGAAFSWKRSPAESAKGSFVSGNRIYAHWGTGFGYAYLMDVDSTGFVRQIRWDNGEIFVRGQDTAPPPTNVRNLALNRPAQMSSQFSWGGPAGAAVDGNMNTLFHTGEDANPWWQVDLGANLSLTEVRLYNRQDACADRARTVQVLLSSDGANWQLVYDNNGTVFGGAADGRPLRVNVQGKQARYVHLRLKEKQYFHLTEVEVYGN